MKKNILQLLLPFVSLLSYGQDKANIGAGYFGENITYPGVVTQYEYEIFRNENFATPLMVNLGFYYHPRSHGSVFLDFNYGTRRYYENGLFLEQFIGLGVMFSFYSEDVWTQNDNGNLRRITGWASPDFLPSVSFGAGYNLSKDHQLSRSIWVRPKLSWQMPYNNLAQPHLAMQVGYSHTINSK